MVPAIARAAPPTFGQESTSLQQGTGLGALDAATAAREGARQDYSDRGEKAEDAASRRGE